MNKNKRVPLYHLARRAIDVPSGDMELFAKAIQESDNQWLKAKEVASSLAVDEQCDPALSEAISKEVAVSLLCRLSQDMNKRVQLWWNWELLDGETAVTTGDTGFVALNAVMVDVQDPGVVFMSMDSLNDPENNPVSVIRYRDIFRAEIIFETDEKWEQYVEAPESWGLSEDG
jgi:hypothetical protein